MTSYGMMLVVSVASVLAACGPRGATNHPTTADVTATTRSASIDALPATADGRIARDEQRNTDVQNMAAKLAADPVLLAEQTAACGGAPASAEPGPLVVPCMAQAQAHRILAQRAARASGGVKNTGSL